MKKNFVIILMLLSASLVFAQKQSGVVKTRGRMENGKLVPGTPLPGATLKVNDGQTVLAKDGRFSFPVKDGKYTLKSVSKQGYNLVDAEACRQYVYSKNQLTIIMETPDRQMQDKLKAERKIRRQMQDQFREKEDEIEELREQNRITEEQYRNALQELYTLQQSNEKLIADMAKRYSELDYDQLDAFQQQVSSCIENGQLAKADSLLRSRGDVGKQVEASLKAGSAIQQQSEQLRKAEAAHNAEKEEIASRCYNYYELFAARFENDTAARYLELRASLDTTNLEWQMDAGKFLKDYVADYKKAKDFYCIGLRQARKQYGDDSYEAAMFLYPLSEVYRLIDEFEKSYDYCQKALAIFEKLGDTLNMAKCYEEMGVFSKNRQNNVKLAIDYNEKALKLLADNESDIAVKMKCSINGNLAGIYLDDQFDFLKAKEMFKNAIDMGKIVYGEDHYAMSNFYVMYGRTLLRLNEFDTAAFYINKAIGIVKEKLGEKHPSIATLYNNLGNLYIEKKEFNKALTCLEKALEIHIRNKGEEHTSVAHTYYNLANLCSNKMKQYPEAQQYSDKAKKIYEKLYGKDNFFYSNCVRVDANTYDNTSQHQKALECYSEVLRVVKNTFGENHQNVASVLCSIGFSCYQNGDISEGVKYFAQGKEIYEKTLGHDHPQTKRATQVLDDMKQKLDEQQKQTKQKNKKTKNNNP